jgi:hypothetical protein
VRIYAPPKSLVSDPPEAAAAEKPAAIRRGAQMLWASLAIGIVNVLFQPGLERPEDWTAWIIVAGAFAIVALLTLAISAGHNWARITFLVFFVIGTLPYLGVLREVFATSAFFGVLSLLQALLQLGAMLLCFTRPGSLWFRRKKTGASQAE